MSAEENKTFVELTDRVRLIVLRYQQEKEDNEELRASLSQTEKALAECRQRCANLENDYKNLKLARMLTVNDTEVAEGKKRINNLVREVDKCIAAIKGLLPEYA